MLSRDQLRSYARAGALHELEDLARKIAVAFPELKVNVRHLSTPAAAPPAAVPYAERQAAAVAALAVHKDPASTRRYVRSAAPRPRRKWSAAARARMALTMKARWRKVKKAGRVSLAGQES